MTDNEIIKALEYCRDYDCVNCTVEDCKDPLCFALSLINRQKTQILKEQNKNSKLRNERNHLKAEIEKLTEQFNELSEVANKLHKENVDQKAEIESLTNKYNLAVSEREANMCGFLEELNRYETERKEIRAEIEEKTKKLQEILPIVAELKAEAVKEFAEIIVADYPEMEYYLDNIKKEMVGEG